MKKDKKCLPVGGDVRANGGPCFADGRALNGHVRQDKVVENDLRRADRNDERQGDAEAREKESEEVAGVELPVRCAGFKNGVCRHNDHRNQQRDRDQKAKPDEHARRKKALRFDRVEL